MIASENSDIIITAILVIVAVVAVGIAALANPKFRKQLFNYHRAPPPARLSNQLRTITDQEREYILATVGAYLAGEGYLTQSQSPGFYVYEKKTPINPLAAILLLFLCLIPGIVYLVVGNTVRTVSMQTVPNERGVFLDIKAPVYLEQRILGQIQSYLIPTP